MDEDKRESGNEEDEDEEHVQSPALTYEADVKWSGGPQHPHSILKLVQPLHERKRTEERTQKEA